MSHAQNEATTVADRPISKPRILVVDDDKPNRDSLDMVFRFNGFDVVSAADVTEALKEIGSQVFDVLLTDLHMPDPGDGLTVASAMRHSHPNAATFIFSGYPEMSAATAAILLQTDQVLLKPMAPGALIETIRKRLRDGGGSTSVNEIESVATILERESKITVEDWYQRAERDSSVITVQLEKSEDVHIWSQSSATLCIAFAIHCPSVRTLWSPLTPPNTDAHGVDKAIHLPCWWRNHGCCKLASFKHCRIIFKR